MLASVSLLVSSGPLKNAKDSEIAAVAYDEFNQQAVMRYVDLQGWDTTDDGQHAALLLEAVSRSLEFRLLLKDRELEKDSFQQAFFEGDGFLVVVPLIQGPPALAEHAMRCLSVIAQADDDAVNHIVGLSTVQALLGLPCPDPKPMPSYVDDTLKASASARRHTAKLLSRCVETEAAMELLNHGPEKVVKSLVKLAMDVREDTGNMDSFHDMLHVFYTISQFRPAALCRFITIEMMNLLVIIGTQEDSTPAGYAQGIIQMLMRDVKCEKMLMPIIDRVEKGTAFAQDPLGLELRKGLTPEMSQLE